MWTGDKFLEYKVGQKTDKESFKNGYQGIRKSLEKKLKSNSLQRLENAPKGKGEHWGTGEGDNFYKLNGGLEKDDFTVHSEKHLYNSAEKSTKKKTQYGKDIDVRKLREDIMMNPDSIKYNDEQNTILYKKEYNFNISTPDTPTGSHRVYINLDPKPNKTNRNSFHFIKENNVCMALKNWKNT
ncbi:hypothetical protein P4H37_22310 [Paenibacillus thiaminolyticus]|uniref:hypothetical protein n=1 Tax=Paenibacillus thiaminolyticus TaxID=49283 RepID=UPI000B3B1E10|nr:hypothetical protein [Paenibacillus thiaminolyticus]MEC0066209.1 hypothetical protein [Paenibacillus thiaminolyticus]SUA51426.1 Uncharacterised protein [Paenibacillus thiaminolyticus]